MERDLQIVASKDHDQDDSIHDRPITLESLIISEHSLKHAGDMDGKAVSISGNLGDQKETEEEQWDRYFREEA